MSVSYLPFIVILAICSQRTESEGPILKAQFTNASFPHGIHSVSASFDGKDSIYIMGGYSNQIPNVRSEIFKFNLIYETLELVGHLPSPRYFGTVQQDSEGKMYIHGDYPGNTSLGSVIQFNPESTEVYLLSKLLPYSVQTGTSAKVNVNSSQVFLFGGQGNRSGIMTFDQDTFEAHSSEISLPREYQSLKSAVFGKEAIVVGPPVSDNYNQDGYAEISPVLIFDMESLKIREGPQDYPNFQFTPNLASNSLDSIFLIGGYHPRVSDNPAASGVIRLKMNFSTPTWDFLVVADFPLEDNMDFFTISPGCNYIPTINRLYFFGGLTDFGNYHTRIWYIDLGPLDEPKET